MDNGGKGPTLENGLWGSFVLGHLFGRRVGAELRHGFAGLAVPHNDIARPRAAHNTVV